MKAEEGSWAQLLQVSHHRSGRWREFVFVLHIQEAIALWEQPIPCIAVLLISNQDYCLGHHAETGSACS